MARRATQRSRGASAWINERPWPKSGQAAYDRSGDKGLTSARAAYLDEFTSTEEAAMKIATVKIAVVQDLKTRHLEAYYGSELLWSKMPTEPGSPEEVVEFYTFTLIELLATLERLSNHQRMAFLARAEGVNDAKQSESGSGFLGFYTVGDRVSLAEGN